MKNYPYTNTNGKKRFESKEWSDIRAEMIQLKTQFNLTDEEFRVLSPYNDHKGIEEGIYQNFCKISGAKNRPMWLWECLKQEVYSVNLPKLPESYLSELINNNESIWFGALGTVREKSKIWFYEGKIQVIQNLLSEICHFDEFYFISKKYEWLICINHHDILIATGGDMPNKLANLERKLYKG